MQLCNKAFCLFQIERSLWFDVRWTELICQKANDFHSFDKDKTILSRYASLHEQTTSI